ncbi:hypothetical protein MKMG_01401 [Methanogenium sp. MK-MG]|nr:hypothetical protein MKMG_01401 [Methanogenium sp. MK-MG]
MWLVGADGEMIVAMARRPAPDAAQQVDVFGEGRSAVEISDLIGGFCR